MTHPIDEYAEAYESYKRGDRETSADKLARSLGGDKATNPIKDSLDKIFDKETLIHRLVVNAVASGSRRRRKDDRRE